MNHTHVNIVAYRCLELCMIETLPSSAACRYPPPGLSLKIWYYSRGLFQRLLVENFQLTGEEQKQVKNQYWVSTVKNVSNGLLYTRIHSVMLDSTKVYITNSVRGAVYLLNWRIELFKNHRKNKGWKGFSAYTVTEWHSILKMLHKSHMCEYRPFSLCASESRSMWKQKGLT